MARVQLAIPTGLPRYFDNFTPLHNIATQRDDSETAIEWWRGQCNFRGLVSSGTLQQVITQLQRLSGGHAREAFLASFHLEAENRDWDGTAFMGKLMRAITSTVAPLAIKVQAGNRLAALRACSSINLVHRSVPPLAGYENHSRWIVIGRNAPEVREKVAEIEHRLDADMKERRAATSRASTGARQEEVEVRCEDARPDDEPEETSLQEEAEDSDEDGESDANPEEDTPQGRVDLAVIMDIIPRASLEELQSIKQRYLMYDGEVLDPDVDVWIPDDPASSRLGLTRAKTSERLKSYWEAQCYLRGIPAENSIVGIQGKLRERPEAIEERIEPLKELCEQVLDAEWRLQHPRVRFRSNVRAVRKARKIMLHPEENAIARNWLTAQVIRPETLARLREQGL